MKFQTSISLKIIGSFIVLILLLAGSAIFLISRLNTHTETITKNIQEVEVALEALTEMQLLVTRSKMLATSWVIIPNDHQDKKALQELHKSVYPSLKSRLQRLANDSTNSTNWNDLEQRQLAAIFDDFEKMLKYQEEIMANLVGFDSYTKAEILIWQGIIEGDITNVYLQTQQKLKDLIAAKDKSSLEAEKMVVESSNDLRQLVILFSVICFGLGLIFALLMARSIVEPIEFLRKQIQTLNLGILPSDHKTIFKDIEVVQMAKAVKVLASNIRATSEFAEEIGKGNYQADYEPLSEHDVLGNALLKMRENLQTTSLQDEERSWISEGLSQINEILKKRSEDLHELADTILRTLIKYIDANQGALLIKKEEKENNKVYLNLLATYAWGKKKHIKQSVQLGEGLAGQAWKEESTIYLEEVPTDYIDITSGLGKALPNSILIVPMVLNEEVFGIIELASFHKFRPVDIHFVEKVGEYIASTLSIIQNNLQTQALLIKTNDMMERLKEQESYLKQNMSILTHTQENMKFVQYELEKRNELFEEIFYMIELNTQGKVTDANELALQMIKRGDEIILDRSLEMYFADRLLARRGFDLMREGKIWQTETSLLVHNNKHLWVKVIGSRIETSVKGKQKFILILMDISLYKEQERLLLQKTEELEVLKKEEKERSDNMIATQKRIMEKLQKRHEEEKNRLLDQIERLEKVSPE